MSDLPPDRTAPQQPAGGPGTPAEAPPAAPNWAVPAVPPAPEMSAAEEAAASAEMPAPVPAAGRTDAPPWASVTPAVQVPPVAAVAPPWAPPVPPGWAPPVPPGPSLAARTFQFNRERWLPSIVVASIIAGVVLGGMGLDKAIAAPSAGTVTVGGSVTLTAAPGWVLAPSQGGASAGVELDKADAILTAQVVSSSYSGDSASMLSDQKQALGGDATTISYGDAHQTTINGHDTTYVVFDAFVSSGQRSGVVDGELVCMVVNGNAVVIVVGAPQGDLDPVIEDVAAMLKSVGAGQ